MTILRWGTKVWLAAMVFVVAVSAQTGELFTSAGSHSLRYGDGFSLGSEFTVETANIAVTALGLYDVTGNGFLQSHDIGLWDVTAGNIEVASATIPTGTAATLLNGFRYLSLDSPVNLNLGDQYILAAFYPTGDVAGVNDLMFDCCGSGSNAATDPNFGGFLAAFSTTGLSISLNHLSEPNGTIAGTDYVGPNLEFASSAPEPGTLLGMGIGLVCLAVAVARERRRRLTQTLLPVDVATN